MADTEVSLHNGVMIRSVLTFCKNEMYVINDENEKGQMVNKRQYARTMTQYAQWMASNYPQLFMAMGQYLKFCNEPVTPAIVEEFYGQTLHVSTSEIQGEKDVYCRQRITIDPTTSVVVEYSGNGIVAIAYFGDIPQQRSAVVTLSELCNLVEKFTAEKVIME